jgi:hypothetical protein
MNADEIEIVREVVRLYKEEDKIYLTEDEIPATISDMLGHIDSQAKQIATLKTALISDRAALITRNLLDDISLECLPRSEDWGDVRGLSVGDRKHIATCQLARVLPGFDWEDIKCLK